MFSLPTLCSTFVLGWLLHVHVYTYFLFLLLLHFNQIVTFVYIFLNSGCTSGATDSTLPVSNPSSNVPPPFSAPAPATTPQTEHRRVFNYSAARSVPNFNPTTRNPPNRHSKRGKKKVQTCTLKFFCLANVEDEKPPATVAGKAFLSNLGLGPGSITLDLNGDTLTIHENLLQRFPPLSLAGGYELLLFQRGGDEQGFHKVPTPYTPSSVKE